MTCFAYTNVSQGSVATCAMYGGIFTIHLTANLPKKNLQVKKKLNRLRFDRIMAMSLCPRFLAHPVVLYGCMLCCRYWRNKDIQTA